MKNRKGSTLVLVLMIFVFLSILATATMSIMMSENSQSVYQKNKIKAYYLARSGAEAVEAAILEIGKDKIDDKLVEVKSSLDVEPIIINGNIVNVKIKREDSKMLIISEATVEKSTEILEKIMEDDNATKIEYPIYASGKLQLSSKVTIESEVKLGCKEFQGNKNNINPGVEEGIIREYTPIGIKKHIASIGYGKIDVEEKFKNDVDRKYINYTNNTKFKSNNNYYIDGDFKTDKQQIIIPENVNIFVNGEIEMKNGKDINIGGNIYSKGKIQISNNNGGLIDIKGNIYCDNEIQIDGNKDINIGGNIYSKNKIQISNNNGELIDIKGGIYSNNETQIDGNKDINIVGGIYSKDKIQLKQNSSGEINIGGIYSDNEIQIEHNKAINIQGSIYSPNFDISIKCKGLNINNGVIIGKDIQLDEHGECEINIKGIENVKLPGDLSNLEKGQGSSYYKKKEENYE